MPVKIFQTQLENLFSNNSLSEDELAPPESLTYPGWVWESDQDGNITYCSPEVEQALGVQASEFISQNLFNFRLSPDTTESIKQVFHDSDEINWTSIKYKHQSGIYLPVNLYILGKWPKKEGHTIIRGFCQLQRSDEPAQAGLDTISRNEPFDETNLPIQAELVEEVDQAEKLRKIRIASQLIIDMLKHLRYAHDDIRGAKDCRILTTIEDQVIEDTSAGKEKTEYLFGKRVVSFPKTTVGQLKHRLEWGIKLDLTEAEKEFTTNNLYQPTSLIEKIRRQMGKRTILKADKSWFCVIIQTEMDQPAKIFLQANPDPDNKDQLTLDEFISDPLVLMPGLRNALQHPYHTREELVRGIDYLIPI